MFYSILFEPTYNGPRYNYIRAKCCAGWYVVNKEFKLASFVLCT